MLKNKDEAIDRRVTTMMMFNYGIDENDSNFRLMKNRKKEVAEVHLINQEAKNFAIKVM